jgi:hypothetical protein
MSTSIVPVHFVNSFNSNVWHLSQQKSSKLAGLVRVEMQKAEKQYYDFYGESDLPVERVNKYADLVAGETVRGRREAVYKNYEKVEYVDHLDKLNMIHDPQGPLSQAFQMAFGKLMDDVIINGALGRAYSGKQGGTPEDLPTSQKIVAFDGTTTTGVGLNVKTLRAIKKKFEQNFVEGQIVLTFTAEECDSLLAENTVISEDYNTVKALVNGAIDTFMGIQFVKCERLLRPTADVPYNASNGAYGTAVPGGTKVTAAKGRRCIAFVKQGVLMVKAEDMTTMIDRLPTKGDTIQIFAKMSFGCTRLEEKCVMEVVTSEI